MKNYIKLSFKSFIYILFLFSAVLLFSFSDVQILQSDVLSPAFNVVDVYAATLKTPKASLKSGTYEIANSQSVSLSCSTKSATIWYSINGGEFQKYTKTLTLKKNTTLSVYSEYKKEKSEVVTYTYKFKVKGELDTPSGKYFTPFTVDFVTDASKVTVYYTTDGSKPTTDSEKLTDDGLLINESCTLRILVKKKGFTSVYFTYKYKLTDKFALLEKKGFSDCVDYSEKDDLSVIENKLFYKYLNAEEKKAYAQIYSDLVNFEETIYFDSFDLTSDRVHAIYMYVISDCPELFYVADGNYIYSNIGKKMLYIKPKYTDSETASSEIKPKLEQEADSIIVNAAEKSENLFEFVMALHDSVVEKTTYTLESSSSRKYAGTNDVILDGLGLCTAYARAFAYLCQRSGIECVMVSGNANTGSVIAGHSWNKIKLDGKWYNMDTCWDDTLGSVYDYFCQNDDFFSSDHSLDEVFDIKGMKCKSDDYSYLTYLGYTVFSDVDAAYSDICVRAEKNYENGVFSTTVYLSDADIAKELSNKLVNGNLRYYYNVSVYYSLKSVVLTLSK